MLAKAFAGLAVVTYGLLVFGASVRVHGAGLACPDWPLCFGQAIPQLDFRIFLEWGHRVLASTVSLGFLAAGGAVLYLRETRGVAGRIVGLAAVALIIQIILGGLTVLHLLAFWSVTLHLLTGNLFLVLLTVTALRLRGQQTATVIHPSLRWLMTGFAGAVVVQMALGGIVSSNYSGLACLEWPTCNGGRWFDGFSGAVTLQILHRIGAYTVLGLAIALFAASPKGLRAWTGAALGVVLLQASLGVANVLLRLPVELAIGHSAVADLLVVLTTLTAYRVYSAQVAIAKPSPLLLSSPERA